MPTRDAYPGDATAGQVLTAANVQRLPGGWIGYAEVTTNQLNITVETDLTGLTVAPSVDTDRRIRVSGYVRVNGAAANDYPVLRIKEGATQLQEAGALLPVAGGSGQATIIAQVVLTPTSGSHTYKLTLERGAGTDVDLVASATEPCFILVEDLGPAT